MLDMVMVLSSVIVNSVVVNAVLDLVINGIPVVLLSLLLGLVLMISVNSIVLLVENSILSKAALRITGRDIFHEGMSSLAWHPGAAS